MRHTEVLFKDILTAHDDGTAERQHPGIQSTMREGNGDLASICRLLLTVKAFAEVGVKCHKQGLLLPRCTRPLHLVVSLEILDRKAPSMTSPSVSLKTRPTSSYPASIGSRLSSCRQGLIEPSFPSIVICATRLYVSADLSLCQGLC